MENKEKFEKFVEEPTTEIFLGITVSENTKRTFNNEIKETGQKINQKIENNEFITKIETIKENAVIKQELIMKLENGTILEYDPTYGYKQPSQKLCKITDAFVTLEAQKDLIQKYEKGE